MIAEIWRGVMTVVGIGLLLFLALRRRRAVALVITNLPFSLVSGVLGAMVGFVMLFASGTLAVKLQKRLP
jgi:Cu/Ag efflux pump CusA